MSTKEARTRARAAWRARTSARPVQVYVHADTLAKLDALVVERGARGRGEVLAGLIEAAHARMPAPVAAPERSAEPVPVPPAARRRTKSPLRQEREEIKADLRKAARACAKAGDEAGRRLAAQAWWERATPSEKRKAPVWLRLPV